MVTVETIGKVRRLLAKGIAIKEIARQCCVSRNTVRKIRDTGMTTPQSRKRPPRPGKLDRFKVALQARLEADQELKPRERRKAVVLFNELQSEGYEGSYDTVRRFVMAWRQGQKNRQCAYIPLVFQKGEAFQFDWSTEIVVLDGVPTTVQVAHVRLCYSRMSFVAPESVKNTYYIFLRSVSDFF